MPKLAELHPMSVPNEWRGLVSLIWSNCRDWGYTAKQAPTIWRMGLGAYQAAIEAGLTDSEVR
jgi:hypothetical protein